MDEWGVNGSLEAELYDRELDYFRHRYFKGAEFTHHFPHLNLRCGDQPDLVHAVINGTNNEPRDRIVAMLMIVWRLRNRLFRGEKWAYQLQGQFNNFWHANAVLMRTLERHGD